MQIATTSTTAATGVVTPGAVIAHATDRRTGAPIDVTVGQVLETGVRDINKAGWKLISATHDLGLDLKHGGGSWGMVGFLRAGDAWTAVTLLMPTVDGPRQIWIPSDVRDVQLAPGVQMESVWQVSHYGGDYTDMAPGWTAPPS
ncbi:MAG: hypothetical protein JWL76_2183 [Thermoleophilia bacterium]|nr:hypothetical protein [Thermoleophilia bacterium]